MHFLGHCIGEEIILGLEIRLRYIFSVGLFRNSFDLNIGYIWQTLSDNYAYFVIMYIPLPGRL